MEELITQLTTKVGLTPDQAHKATDTVLAFLKTKLPAPFASQLDALLAEPVGAKAAGLGEAAQKVAGKLDF